MEQYLKVFLLFQLFCDKNDCLTWRRNNASSKLNYTTFYVMNEIHFEEGLQPKLFTYWEEET
jgi:hypothetical protein